MSLLMHNMPARLNENYECMHNEHLSNANLKLNAKQTTSELPSDIICKSHVTSYLGYYLE